MPQVPSRPPPYSIECSSFPPPIEAAAGPQAWAFQRAFESAREPVRWAVLTTMRCWDSENKWTYQGVDIPRHLIQHVYDRAPPDLKETLDYIIENKLPFYFLSDWDRRCYNLCRTGRVQEVETSILSQDAFTRLYDASLETVKDAIVDTVELWTVFEDHKETGRIPKSEAVQHYAIASDSLKVVLSWMVETGCNIGSSNQLAFERRKATFHEVCLNHATAHVELHAMNRLAGMY